MAPAPEDDEEKIIYYEPTPTQKIVDVNVIYLLWITLLLLMRRYRKWILAPQDATF
jgi:hypothetical protein